MNTSGRSAVADPDSWALCSSPPSLPSRIARWKLSSCISIAYGCQKIILSSQTALERLRGITRVHYRYHCAGPGRNSIHVSRWSFVILSQDCSVTFPDESAASGTEGYSLPCLWFVLLSWPAWPTGRAGRCPRGPVSLGNVAALRNLCLQGFISESAQVPALSQWRQPSSSSCFSGNCVCTGGSHLYDHSCCCWREGAWFCLEVQSCFVLRCQSMAEAAPSSRELAPGLFWEIQS